MQISLKWMLAAVALVGIGSVALYGANETWAGAVFALTALILFVAILGAIYLQPRPFYIGMCVFGWGYLLLTYVPTGDGQGGLADVIFKAVYNIMHGTDYAMTTPGNFRTVGHSLFALAFALTGGAVGQCFSRGAKCNST